MAGRWAAVLGVAAAVLAAMPSAADEPGLSLAAARAAFDDRDYVGARELAQPLAESGDAGAQTLLGVLHRSGMLGLADRDQAAEWFKLAVAQGDAEAEFNLGLMYYQREARPPQRPATAGAYQAAAAANFGAAAEHGHPMAQLYLGHMVAAGIGVDPDPVEGYKWYQLAAWQRVDLAVAALDRLSTIMSAAELEEARTRASRFRARLVAVREETPGP